MSPRRRLPDPINRWSCISSRLTPSEPPLLIPTDKLVRSMGFLDASSHLNKVVGRSVGKYFSSVIFTRLAILSTTTTHHHNHHHHHHLLFPLYFANLLIVARFGRSHASLFHRFTRSSGSSVWSAAALDELGASPWRCACRKRCCCCRCSGGDGPCGGCWRRCWLVWSQNWSESGKMPIFLSAKTRLWSLSLGDQWNLINCFNRPWTLSFNQVVAVKSEISASTLPPPTSSLAKSRDDVVKRDVSDDVVNDDASEDVAVSTTTVTTSTTTTVGPGTKFENAFLQYLAKHTATPSTTNSQVSARWSLIDWLIGLY